MHPCGLHLIIGKKGAGKSMLAVKMLVKILVESNRVIITNLPLNMSEIVDYIQTHFGKPLDLHTLKSRVTLITDARILKRFWLTLGNDWWIPDVPKEQWNLGQRLDYRECYRWTTTTKSTRSRKPIADLLQSEIQHYLSEEPPQLENKLVTELPPCQFIIDELQNIFPARGFMQTSPGCLFWLSQQRHLGADLIGLTQNADLIDKEFRDLADDYLYITNWGRKQKSFFRLPKMMTWSKYDMKPAPGIKPMVTGMFRMDVNGLGQLYDTSAGVGIEGALDADTKEKVKGFHWSWFVLIVILVIYLLSRIPGCAHNLTMRLLKGKPKTNLLTSDGHIAVSNPSPPTTSVHSASIFNAVHIRNTNLTGIAVWGQKARCYFLDGTVITSDDKDRFGGLLMRGPKPSGAIIDGTNCWLD